MFSCQAKIVNWLSLLLDSYSISEKESAYLDIRLCFVVKRSTISGPIELLKNI